MGTRNRFGSVALTQRLEGFIPWFLAPKPEIPTKATINLPPLHFTASPAVYLSKRRIILHGLERSGTGFCSEILKRNIFFAQVVSEFKHGAFDKDRLCGGGCYYRGNSLTKYIVVVRNPYSWLISYRNYHINRASDPTVLVKLTHGCNGSDIHRLNKDKIECYIRTWNEVYNEWIEEIPKYYEHAIVRYEDLLEYPVQTLTLLCSRLNLERFESFENVLEYMNNYSGHSAPHGNFSRKDYYLKKQYMDALSRDDIARINRIIDKELMCKLGYSLES